MSVYNTLVCYLTKCTIQKCSLQRMIQYNINSMMHIQTCTTKTKLSQTVTVLCKFKEKVYKQTILIYKSKLKNKKY